MLIQAILYGLVCIMTVLMPDAGNMLTLKALDSGLIQHTLTTVSFTHPKTRLLSYARQNAEHFARKHGLAIADAVGMIGDHRMLAWAAILWAGWHNVKKHTGTRI